MTETYSSSEGAIDGGPLKAEIASIHADLAAQRSEMERRLTRLESQFQSGPPQPTYFEVRAALETVMQITREVFPSTDFKCAEREDPESDDRHFEIRVPDRGTIPEILARDDEWHRRLLAIPSPTRGLFRLLIDAQD